MVFVAVLLPIQADVMLTPGPRMCTQLPKFENDAKASLMSVAPTVIDVDALDGELLHASAELLPAAMAYVTPAAVDRSPAALSVDEKPPPRLMLAAAGSTRFAVTHSMPPIPPHVHSQPLQSSTRTAPRLTFFPTPSVCPPTLPD